MAQSPIPPSSWPGAIDTFVDPAASDFETDVHKAEHAKLSAATVGLETALGAQNATIVAAGVAVAPALGQNTPTVMQWSGGFQSAVHKAFWPLNTDLGPCAWEAWICPLTLAGSALYWISDGFGGNHAILAGLNAGVPTGNILINGSLVSFGGDYTAAVGEWLHMRVEFNGTVIWTRINGVPVATVAASGSRTSQDGDLYIGGSDHQNFNGRIAMVRAFEGVLPVDPTDASAVIPVERPFMSEDLFLGGQRAQFLVDFSRTAGGLTVDDLSGGYMGRAHPLSLWSGNLPNKQKSSRPLAQAVYDPTCPFDPSADIKPVTIIPTPPATPGGAKIFDSFSRADQLPAFQLALTQPTLGSTEAGSLGSLAWGGTTGLFGIQQGRAVCCAYGGMQFVNNNSADMDVRVDRRVVTGVHETGLCFRAGDTTNYWRCYTKGNTTASSGDGFVVLEKVIAGVPTGVGGALNPPATSWTTLRVTTAGNVITVYVDNGSGGWTQIVQVTDAALNANVGAGLFAPGSSIASGVGFRRHDNFAVL